MRIILRMAFVYFFLISHIYASEIKQPIPIGNFSLPRSQRPGALYSFGSNIIEPGQLIGKIQPNIYEDSKTRDVGSGGTLLLGTSKKTSLLFSLPITASTRPSQDGRTAGIGNIGLQGEYELYHRTSLNDTEQLAFISGFAVPSGTEHFSSPNFSYFFAGTYNHTWQDWIFFAAPGLLQWGGDPKTRTAPRLYYNAGLGRNILSKSGEYIFAGFFEVNGQHDNKNRSAVPVTRNSGGRLYSDGNILYISPSLFFSTPKWLLQFDVSIPMTQTWLGTRDRVDYFAGISIAYTFT